MQYSLLAISAVSAASLGWDKCTNKPDGTQFPDPNNAQGYIECQNGKSTFVDCDAGLWYIPLTRECLDEPPMCNAPPNFQEAYDQVHSYKNGIYYMSTMKPEQERIFTNFEALFFCSIMQSYVAMPYVQEEYDMVKLTQDKAIERFRAVPNPNPDLPPLPPANKTDHEFFMGIVGQNVGQNNKNPLSVEWRYYNIDRHWDNVLDGSRGLLFNETSWWAPGFPTTDHRGTGNKNEKKTVQISGVGMQNRPYSYEANGVNCMYVCPQKNP